MINVKKFRFLVLLSIMVFSMFYTSPSVLAADNTFKLKEQKATIHIGDVKNLQVITSSINKKKVLWQSSNSKIAIVDKKGNVKGITTGAAKITAYIPKTKLKVAATITVVERVYDSKGIFKKVNQSIVYIELYNQFNQLVSSGSGIIISKDGKIATNLHVINDISLGQYVKIKLSDGKSYKTSKVLGYDEKEDLAIVKIDGPNNLPVAELGDSTKISTGEKVYALGSPLGIQNTMTEGIISNTSIPVEKVTRIQTSAPISPGNSGGALVNQNGKVIGVVVASLIDGQNMNLAIPINKLKALKTNNNTNLLDLNRKIYPPLSGKGEVDEQEDNGYLDNADPLVNLENDIYGSVADINDMDLFMINLTENKTISVTATTEDASLSSDLGVTLYDKDGNEIITSDNNFSNADNCYFSELVKDLSPGTYYVGFYAYSDSKLSWNKNNYMGYVEFK
jgi:hypothetical protein